ncbi:MAG: response regulator transcription factor [Acidobacteriota bacterium]|nr:response regulator transcription factor [Acidobacteriota bacterium]
MKKRLLVVEDNFRLLQAINVCLTKAGFEVMTARDGNAALERIAETIPDLIVSDIMMPGMDGFLLAAQIRANPRTDLIPIVFLTAKETRQDRIAGFKVGIDAYLVKPFEPDELVAAIENILSRVSRTHRRVARTSKENNQTAPAARKSPPVSDLTEAEERIANLVGKTLSNKEIAAQLNISVRTVEMHISNILSKKGWSNRVEIARFVIERDSAQRSGQ